MFYGHVLTEINYAIFTMRDTILREHDFLVKSNFRVWASGTKLGIVKV